MNMNLKGKTAIVTGSSRGIGHAIATALSQEGCTVVMNGRDENALAAAAADIGGTVTTVAGDVRKSGICEKIVAVAYGLQNRLDIVVCNGGSGRSAPPGDETGKDWAEMLDVNLASATNMTAASEDALSANGGAIVCVSSICGLEALGAPIPYSAAKAALNAYVKNAARPLAQRGIRINAVAPGNVLFDGSVWEQKLKREAPAVKQMLDRDVALGRLGTPQEIADMAVFLASPRASFGTGSIVVVDGGQVRS